MTQLLSGIDHLVLTTGDVDKCIEFYTRVLGMRRIEFGSGRLALQIGEQKINLHAVDALIAPRATNPTPGSLDLCFLSARPLHEVLEQLRANGIEIVEGPVARNGAQFPLLSIYIRDPDGNLIEISERAHFD